MKNNRIIAIVPARSGSKGFPDKNIAKVRGVSLLEMAIACGINCKMVDEVYVSTDSDFYEKLALKKGAKSLGLRDRKLSGDDVKTIDVLIDMLRAPELSDVSHIVLLQATSPIRTTCLVDQAVERCLVSNNSVVSVAKIDEPHPYKMKVIKNGVIHPFIEGMCSEVPRQKLPPVYQLTGSVYVSSVDNIMKNNSLFSPSTEPVEQFKFINIDSKDDFEYFKYLLDGSGN